MTASCLMVHWFEHLVEKGVLQPNSSMLEFGPQDVSTPRDVVEAVAGRLFSQEEAHRRIAAIFDGPGARRDCQDDFYSLFGISRYRSLDPFDDRADYRYDLGYFVPLFRRYDMISNFGTLEHVFNTANVLRTAHRLLRRGGVLLNVMPAFGDINHGFFNIHPLTYATLAKQSGYEICDFRYIDDIGGRTAVQEQKASEKFDFDTLPISFVDMEDEAAFKDKVLERFVATAAARNWGKPEGQAPRGAPVFDYCFVALRKETSGLFRPPYQYAAESANRFGNLLKFFNGAGQLRRLCRHVPAMERLRRFLSVARDEGMRSALAKASRKLFGH